VGTCILPVSQGKTTGGNALYPSRQNDADLELFQLSYGEGYGVLLVIRGSPGWILWSDNRGMMASRSSVMKTGYMSIDFVDVLFCCHDRESGCRHPPCRIDLEPMSQETCFVDAKFVRMRFPLNVQD
jgi:hypothetical protein